MEKKKRGRPRKQQGYVQGYVRGYALIKPRPRGKAARSWDFTVVLKERVPLVYAFVVEEMKKPIRTRDKYLQNIIQEWTEENKGDRRLSSLVLTAYVIERAFAGAWEKWEIKPPYSSGDHDAFRRRYVYGHPGALQTFRRVLKDPQPWSRFHVGHDLQQYYLADRGGGIRRYPWLLKGPQKYCVVNIDID